MPATLAYWDIRGLAHPIRTLLHYVGEEYEDKMYSVTGEAPNFSRESWLTDKFNLNLDFPNLPYYIDSDIKISQTNAILRYIARKHNMCGTTDAERAMVDMLADQVMDFRNGFIVLCYGSSFDAQLPSFKEQLPAKLQQFETFLADKQFIIGDKLTFPDFHLYEMLFAHREISPDCLTNFPKLVAYMSRFEAVPAIKAYMESDKYQLPLNNKMAKFGSKI